MLERSPCAEKQYHRVRMVRLDPHTPGIDCHRCCLNLHIHCAPTRPNNMQTKFKKISCRMRRLRQFRSPGDLTKKSGAPDLPAGSMAEKRNRKVREMGDSAYFTGWRRVEQSNSPLPARWWNPLSWFQQGTAAGPMTGNSQSPKLRSCPVSSRQHSGSFL